MFLRIGVPQNGWFIMEHLIKMDDLGVYHYFQKHPDEDMQSADDGLVYECSL